MIDNIIKESQIFDQKDKDLIKNSGVVFTDSDVCNKIILGVNPTITDSICEPSVGKGAFVFTLLEYFRNTKNHRVSEILNFVENNLFCFDINLAFISKLKELLRLYFKELGYDGYLNLDNIKVGDFLLETKNYDLIIGNPPYVRIQNLDKDKLEVYKKDLITVTMGNIDLYYAFIEKALKSSTRFSFIIPNSFIKNKSGKFLRDLILPSLVSIYNYDNNKVWKNISTYTCIILCDNTTTHYELKYDEFDYSIDKDKSELYGDWLFKELSMGTNPLLDELNSISGGIATLKDSVFIMDYYDDEYCYKGDFKIEKASCLEYIKATKCKTFSDFKYIIYPYKDNVIIEEQELSTKYPLCYEYLKEHRTLLDNRDKGKIEKYDSWYAYGRKQGLSKKEVGRRIIIPLTFLKSKGLYIIDVPTNIDCVMTSGLLLDIPLDKYDSVISIVTSKEFYEYCHIVNKTFKDKDDTWLFLNVSSIKKYLFN
jgi:hypothetical protein